MSGYGDRRGYSGRDDGGGRRRSISPRGDRRGDDRYARDDRRPRGGGDYRRGDSSHSGESRSTGSKYSDLPQDVEVPKSGKLFENQKAPLEGKGGKLVKVLVNHFEIQSLPTVKTYAFDLSFNVPPTSQRRGSSVVSAAQLTTLMGLDATKQFLGPHFVFDGVSRGYSVTPVVPAEQMKTEIIDLPGSKPERLNQVEITMRNAGKLDIKAIVDYIRGGRIDLDPRGNPAVETILKWINAVYRQDPAARFVTRPNVNAYFERTQGTYMPLRSTADVLEALRGIFQTVQLRFGRLTVNVDTATTAFWAPDKPLIDLVRALGGVSPRQSIEEWALQDRGRFEESCNRLVGIYFNVRHLSERRNARKVKFSKWSKGDALNMEFEFNNEGQAQRISVANYYLLKYKIKLQYPRLPMADTKDGWFPLELCYSAPGERFKEPLQGAETADFIKFATAPGNVRQQQIYEGVRKLGWHKLETPKSMGLSVKTQMLELPARLLQAPIPQYGRGSDSRPSDMGAWNLRGKQFLKPCTIKAWGLMYFPAGAGADPRQLEEFSRAVQRSFQALGITVPRDLPAMLTGNPHGDLLKMVAELLSKTKDRFRAAPDLLMFLIHGPTDRLYKMIKYACEVQFGVASQVMVITKATNQRGQMQYLANIGLKVNVKMGGINAMVDEPLFKKSRWMILGGDTSHPSAGQLRMNPPPPTFTALTASYDRSCTAYSSISAAQFSKDQMINDFAIMIKELFNRYRERNDGKLPDSIIYYRDGISESQMTAIMAEEVEPLREACHDLGSHMPKITVVICIKRHHTRMFPTDRGDKLGNVLPGTLVENNGGLDIYMVAHAGLQGTVRPTRYAVLMDQNNLSADDFQRLTNNLCWSYARATRAVSIVPPVYYADQSCERARSHIREGGETQVLAQVHDSLKYSMYWQ